MKVGVVVVVAGGDVPQAFALSVDGLVGLHALMSVALQAPNIERDTLQEV